MEATKQVSKRTAGSILTVAVTVVFAASAYAVQNEPNAVTAVPAADGGRVQGPDTTEAVLDAPAEQTVASNRTASSQTSPTTIEGRASYYGYKFAGKPTANGESFDPMGLTAAHRTLPFGSLVRVTHTETGRSVIVRINDRGPFVRGRIIDVSLGAAEQLGMISSGIAPVRIEVLP